MSIFVSIANYRDSETPHTVMDLLNKAKFKDLITVGVLSQIDKQNETHCLAPRLKNVVQETVDYRQSKGVCWARSRILNELRKNETFVLQIDSHMRFVYGWDEMLIRMMYECGHNAVITHYPAGYQPPETFDPPNRYLRLAYKSLTDHGIPIIGSDVTDINDAPLKPQKTALYSGNFSFAYSSTYNHVPYDPYIYFLGEETTMAVRLYTHGYDLYAPNKHIAWHQFNIDKELKKPRPRPLHWTDSMSWGVLEDLSRIRIQHLLKIRNDIDPSTLAEIERYGLGKARTLNEYQNFSGMYFKTRTMEVRAKTGFYP